MTPYSTATPAGESLPVPPLVQPGVLRAPSGLTWWGAGLVAFGFAPLVLEFFANIWRLPQYQFFPGALAAAGFLVHSRLSDVRRPLSAGRPLVTAPVLLFSFALLVLAVLLWSPWLGTIAFVIGVTGMIWWAGGWGLLKHMIPAMVMVLTIIPPPLGLDSRLTLFLRGIATTASSRLLDALHVVHNVTGNVLELPQQKLLVEEACSGINSVLVISAFTLFYLLWCRRSLWCYVICLPAAVGFVVMGNVVRITLGAWLRFHGGTDLLNGWKHEAIGLILVVIYIGLVMSLEHLLYWPPHDETEFLPALRRKKKKPSKPKVIKPAVRYRIPPVWGWAAAIVFGAMGLAGAARCYEFHKESRIQHFSGQSALRSGATFDLPKQIGPWTRLTTGKPALRKLETIGLSSMIWEFKGPSNTVAGVAFDYPIWGYHDVTLCYIENGWNITRRDRISKIATTPPWLELKMQNDAEGHGALWVATINERGQWMEVPEVRRSFLERLSNPGVAQETSYRIQLLIVSSFPLSAEEREEATGLFQEARRLLAQQLLGQLKPGSKPAP